MSVDRRQAGRDWQVLNERGDWYQGSYAGASLAVLMDVRDELRKLNAVFACPNFLAVPSVLRGVEKNTRKPRRKAAKKP